MTERTIIHKIVDGQLPSTKVYDTDNVLAFKDINPKAPTHVLFVAKNEQDFVASIADLTPETAHVPGMLIQAAHDFAKQEGIDGYKLVFHVGKGGGQEIFYLHLHFLSQTSLS